MTFSFLDKSVTILLHREGAKGEVVKHSQNRNGENRWTVRILHAPDRSHYKVGDTVIWKKEDLRGW